MADPGPLANIGYRRLCAYYALRMLEIEAKKHPNERWLERISNSNSGNVMKHTSYQQQLNTDEILQRHPAVLNSMGNTKNELDRNPSSTRRLACVQGFLDGEESNDTSRAMSTR
ncbi:hypothetical protein B0H13DRAFT_1935322 [Mycena leptocephala]|nr:hypothetical protein B0H13DRAFT_1935322 [Mycena leptocephala]